MIEAHLGETIDIHAGGLDLIFPHHENEIAQSRCAHAGAPLARYWLHNGFLSMAGAEKMSKSLGNVVTVAELLEQGHKGETRSEEHTSELQSLMRISYAVFCLKKKKQYINLILNITS